MEGLRGQIIRWGNAGVKEWKNKEEFLGIGSKHMLVVMYGYGCCCQECIDVFL